LAVLSGGKSLCRSGWQSCTTRSGGQVAQRVGSEVREPDVWRELVDDERFRRTREDGLTAVRQVAQPGGAVDGRADVVALVAQSHVAGVDADAQLDRRQGCAPTPRRKPPRRRRGRTRSRSCPLALLHRSPHRHGPRECRKPCDPAARPRPSSPPVGYPTAASSPRRRPTATSPFRSAARSAPLRSSSLAARPRVDQSRSWLPAWGHRIPQNTK
jgi:hypothetical protein